MSQNDRHTCRVVFEPAGEQVNVTAGTTLLEAARKAGLILNASCGGASQCGQCRLTVIDGRVSAPTEKERSLLAQILLDRGVRLACNVSVSTDVKVHVPRKSLASEISLQVSGASMELEMDPRVYAETVAVTNAGGTDPQDFAQILNAAAGRSDLIIEPEVANQVSDLLRQNRRKLGLYIREPEVVGAAHPKAPPLGVAVDLGSTKIAAGLVNLTTGKVLSVAAELNPQIPFGEDMISRLNYALQNAGGRAVLAARVRASIDALIGNLVAQAGTGRHQVADVCIVGNTVMTHLLLELPVDRLAVAPFRPASLEAVDIKTRKIGLETAPGAHVHLLPGIGGFVGADHVAMMMAAGIDNDEGVVIGMDIGTNTEIVLTDAGRNIRVAASCASGPAFEGGQIHNGMRAGPGAIRAVRLTDNGPMVKTVDESAPIGLCGSGIIDAVWELRRKSIINASGRFTARHERLRQGAEGTEYILVREDESGNGRPVVVTQQDINHVQLAKGAIRAGLACLLESTETSMGTVREVVIAGAFGSFLNIRNACRMDLLPRFPNAAYRQIGNAALQGALRALLSRQERRHAALIAAGTQHLELTSVDGFNRHFARGMQFPE